MIKWFIIIISTIKWFILMMIWFIIIILMINNNFLMIYDLIIHYYHFFIIIFIILMIQCFIIIISMISMIQWSIKKEPIKWNKKNKKKKKGNEIEMGEQQKKKKENEWINREIENGKVEKCHRHWLPSLQYKTTIKVRTMESTMTEATVLSYGGYNDLWPSRRQRAKCSWP